jgi:hypothetical protein
VYVCVCVCVFACVSYDGFFVFDLESTALSALSGMVDTLFRAPTVMVRDVSLLTKSLGSNFSSSAAATRAACDSGESSTTALESSSPALEGTNTILPRCKIAQVIRNIPSFSSSSNSNAFIVAV